MQPFAQQLVFIPRPRRAAGFQLRAALAFAAFMLITPASWAGSPDAATTDDAGIPHLQSVTFENGAIDAPYLPYGRPFKITGKTATPTGHARIIYFEISKEEDPATKDRYIWVDTSSASRSADDFTIIVDNPLELGVKYIVQAKFYATYELPAEAQHAIIRTTLARLVALYSSPQSITGDDLKKFLKEETLTYLDGLGRAREPLFLTVDRFNRTITGIPVTNLEAAIMLAGGERAILLRYAAQVNVVKQKVADIASKRDQLRNVIATPEFAALAAALRNALQIKDVQLPYTAADINAIGEIESINSDLPEMLLALKKMKRTDIPPVITDADLTFLTALQAQRIPVMDAEQRLAVLRREESELLKKSELMTITLLDSYLESLSSQTYTYGFASQSELEKINVGSNYGFAVAATGRGSTWGASAFQYTGITIHFGAVDRSLPDPFMGKVWNRFSLLFGFVVGDPPKFGRAQLSPVGKYTPVLGLNIALYRFVTLDLAAVVVQQSRSDSLSSANPVRIAPSVGISLDPDLFNTVRDLLKNGL